MASVQHIHCGQALLREGWVQDVRIAIRDGLCVEVATGVAARNHEHHPIMIPGMPNVHSHAFQRGMAGMAEKRGQSADSFWTWRDSMYRFVDRVGPAELAAIASLAYIEMLETGFTRVGEFHYLHHDLDGQPFADRACMAHALSQAASEAGIALTLLPVFYAHAGFGGRLPTAGQRRFVSNIDGFSRLLEASRDALGILPDAVLGIAPHSLRAVTPDELRHLQQMAPVGPVHIHIAEQIAEVEDCAAWSGARPVEWLLQHAAVDQRWCLVHATHMTDLEARAMAATGATAGLCPMTEANLGDGLFNAEVFLQSGGQYGIGSDSNVLIDLSEELRLLEYGQRLDLRKRNVLADATNPSTGAAIFGGALAGGGRALGGEVGLAVGLPFDAVTLHAQHPSIFGKTDSDLLDSWIFAGGRGAIDCVWRRGEKLVENGRHRLRAPIEERYRAAIQKVMS